MTATGQEYIPGVCNIGPQEIAKRRALGWIGLVVSVLMWATFAVLKTAPAWRMLLFLPVMLSALGFLQAAWRFCVKYGFEGAFKFGSKTGRPSAAERAKFRSLDRRTALAIIGLSTLIGLVVALAASFITL